jgi:hypothetical protein
VSDADPAEVRWLRRVAWAGRNIQNWVAIDAVDPARLEAYLRATGWMEQPDHWARKRLGDKLAAYATEVAEVSFPRDRSFADYVRRAHETLVAIGSIEDRPPHEVLAQLLPDAAGEWDEPVRPPAWFTAR